MTERVQCAECADTYDSDEHPFCPRCGAVATAAAPGAALSLAGRNDPSRRRVQVAGVIMMSTGGIVLALGLAWLLFAGVLAGAMFDNGLDQESSPIQITVVDANGPVAGVNVSATPVGGTESWLVTGANGTAVFAMQSNAFVDLRVDWGAGNWSQRVAAISLGGQGPVELTINTDDGAPVEPLLDQSMARQSVRIFGAIATIFGALPVISGIAAVRLRKRSTAQTGAIIGALPWLLLFFVSMNIVVLLVLALQVAALVFIRKGRAHFAS